ncbi:Os09g0124300, partial [Oryza sativa Japonica Group]
LHPRGAGAVSPRRASVPPAPLSLSRREPAPPTASTGDGASHRILLRRCLPPHPPASPPPLGSRCRHRRRLTSDLPEQPLVDASAAATDFPGAAFLPPSADIRSIGNYFSVQSPLSGHRVFPNKNLLEEHLLLHQLGLIYMRLGAFVRDFCLLHQECYCDVPEKYAVLLIEELYK